ncbi:rhomboid family intramembrane serine protease [Tropicimonas sp.]|uniref:rhomboid family intramembrane serine protease n=1 Tax=Tropicimonas sp. TaxID=2067044 RepID=UPI003A87ECF6
MFPIRDHNPSGRAPLVTYLLIAANVVVFLLTWPLMEDPRQLYTFYSHWALIPADPNLHSYVTSMFLHGGIMHLAGNMLFLYIFGDNMEDEMGHVGFLLFYLACGVGAGLVHVLLSPGSVIPTVGASGAIAGVLGGYVLLYPRARVDVLLILVVYFRVFTAPAWIVLGIWFAMQVFGVLGSDPQAGGVAYAAHAGGFLIGVLLTVPVWLRRGGPEFWNRNHGLPPHPARQNRQGNQSIVRQRQSSVPKVRRRR